MVGGIIKDSPNNIQGPVLTNIFDNNNANPNISLYPHFNFSTNPHPISKYKFILLKKNCVSVTDSVRLEPPKCVEGHPEQLLVLRALRVG